MLSIFKTAGISFLILYLFYIVISPEIKDQTTVAWDNARRDTNLQLRLVINRLNDVKDYLESIESTDSIKSLQRELKKLETRAEESTWIVDCLINMSDLLQSNTLQIGLWTKYLPDLLRTNASKSYDSYVDSLLDLYQHMDIYAFKVRYIERQNSLNDIRYFWLKIMEDELKHIVKFVMRDKLVTLGEFDYQKIRQLETKLDLYRSQALCIDYLVKQIDTNIKKQIIIFPGKHSLEEFKDLILEFYEKDFAKLESN